MAARHKRRGVRRGAKVVLVVVAVLGLLGGGSAYAAYRYDLSAAAEILPGISIAGVDVGGMTREAAIRAVEERADLTLDGELLVRAAGHSWTLTPAALGTTVDVEGAVDRAFAVSDGLSFFSRLNHRIREIPVGRSFDLEFRHDEAAVDAFVRRVSEEVAVPAVDARFALVEDEIVTRRSREGEELKTGLASVRILRALRRHAESVEIPMRTVAPEVPTSALGTSIVVDVSENRLWLYEGLKVVEEYGVATGTPGFPTPVGSFEIVDKRENPTWTNPDPDGWGAGLPAFIPGGPGNPLGTRALYLDAPGIRIHGTWDDSSIGTAASHGCIRMHVEDSEEMYPLVPVGARVLVRP
ncbi:MAG TPA: L,D-transpeptidase/peptidoglycan binding protein [Actinomycetota bacterium]